MWTGEVRSLEEMRLQPLAKNANCLGSIPHRLWKGIPQLVGSTFQSSCSKALLRVCIIRRGKTEARQRGRQRRNPPLQSTVIPCLEAQCLREGGERKGGAGRGRGGQTTSSNNGLDWISVRQEWQQATSCSVSKREAQEHEEPEKKKKKKTKNKEDKPYKRLRSRGQVQGHQNEQEHIIFHAHVRYRHVQFECNSLHIVRDIAS